MGLLDGRNALIFGVANGHSIAWGIAKALHEHGATVGFSSLESLIERRVARLAASLGSTFVEPCDVRDDAAVKAVFDRWGAEVGSLDILVHALAFANREDLEGAFVDTSRDGFALAMDVSAYSLVALAREARPHLRPGASILTLTYYGAEKVVAHYNVMGVAKAALEACVRYLAADLGPAGRAGQRDLGRAGADARRPWDRRLPNDARRRSATWRRCARASRSRTSRGPRSGWPATSRARSPARPSTWTAASASWGCQRRRRDRRAPA